MTVGQIVLDVAMAGVVLSLLSIVLFFVIGAGVCLWTAAGGGRASRQRSRRLDELSSGCAVSELAEIDRNLDRVLAEEHGRLPTPGRAG